MQCQLQDFPLGWRVWRGDVPALITQAAIDVRDHIRSYPLGSVAKTLDYNGRNVAFWVSNHTWTWVNGVLQTGICIRGVTVVIPPQGDSVSLVQDSIATPDPTAAVYGESDQATGIDALFDLWLLPLVIGAGFGLAASGLYALTTSRGSLVGPTSRELARRRM